MNVSLTQLDACAPPSAPSHTQRRDVLIDAHGRTIEDLRLSITDRCNFRCIYCMEPDDRFLPKRSLLSLTEYLNIVDAAIDMGVRKIRITGGEPTLYPELDTLIRELGRRPLDDIAMTTNGWWLDATRLTCWKSDGLTRLTFSLDTLREERMAVMTRSKTSVQEVLSSIDKAAHAGFPQAKINVVALRGQNDDECADFADLARSHDLHIRFIEFMPLDSGRSWQPSHVFSEREMVEAISRRHPLQQQPTTNPHSTSLEYVFADGAPGKIGIIASVTRPFCGACNRLRITAEGAVRPCLFSNQEWDLRPVLRAGGGIAEIKKFLRDATWTKQAGHSIGQDDFRQPDRSMSAIGG
ncbi:MAG: GTP 3',8-cyclase MoaA [Phycisphaerales bacterium]|nr:GTP 3',8-cyclase MoaA [Phycisphaerales bacterium]